MVDRGKGPRRSVGLGPFSAGARPPPHHPFPSSPPSLPYSSGAAAAGVGDARAASRPTMATKATTRDGRPAGRAIERRGAGPPFQSSQDLGGTVRGFRYLTSLSVADAWEDSADNELDVVAPLRSPNPRPGAGSYPYPQHGLGKHPALHWSRFPLLRIEM